ncbi:MAG TPA: hypothetical protein PK948_11940 [Gemmatimonadales bacterium]|jgi:hypothetical protein|nr:hypothetical protein [Gemmatimonadales bacterium]
MTPRLRVALLLAGIGLAGAVPTQAQVLGGLTYSWANPAGDLSDNFIGNDSWLGFSVEGRRFLNPNATIGVSLGYTAFYESTTDPIFFPGGTVSGEQYRSMNIFPLLVTGHLYSKAGGKIQTYIGLGVGVYYMKQLMDVGPGTVTTNNWIMGFAPELGFILNKGAQKEIAIFGKYNYPANAGKYLGGESGSYQYLSVGLSFMARR